MVTSTTAGVSGRTLVSAPVCAPVVMYSLKFWLLAVCQSASGQKLDSVKGWE